MLKIVLIILGVLGGGVLLMCCGGFIFGLAGARGMARDTQSKNNLKQIGLAMHNYHDMSLAFPPAGVFDESGRGSQSWQTAILPYIGISHLQFNKDVPWDDPSNVVPFSSLVPQYLNPHIEEKLNARGYGLSHYAGNSQVLLRNTGMPMSEVKDGTSNTMLAGESAGSYRPWADPENVRDPAAGANAGPNSFGRPGSDHFEVLMMDGAARTISNSIDPNVLKAIATPAGGEQVSLDN